MKLPKRMFLIVLSIAVLVSVMVFPASAVVNPDVRAKMAGDNFPYLYMDVDNKPAVKALQRFLLTDVLNTSYADIYHDKLDGGYGDHCVAAVRSFQVRHGILGPNKNGTGEVKNQTWGAIADVLTQDGYILQNTEIDIYKYEVGSMFYYFYYFDLSGDPHWFVHA